MKRLTILIDMDDVLNNAVDCWVDHLNELYGTDTHVEDVTSWDIHKAFPTLNKEDVYSPAFTSDFWIGVKPRQDNIECINMIINDGHKVVIVTASTYQTMQTKMDLFFKYCPYLTWDDVIVTSQKQLVRGDVLIDDGVHNLEGGKYFKILIDRPHNRNYDAESRGMVRVSSLEEAYEAILNSDLMKDI